LHREEQPSESCLRQRWLACEQVNWSTKCILHQHQQQSLRALKSATLRSVLYYASSSPRNNLCDNARSSTSKVAALKPVALQKTTRQRYQSSTGVCLITQVQYSCGPFTIFKITACQGGKSSRATSRRRRVAAPCEPLAVTPSSRIATLQSSRHSYATGHPGNTTRSKPATLSTCQSGTYSTSGLFIPIYPGKWVQQSYGAA
jgi:hypothetical protein